MIVRLISPQQQRKHQQMIILLFYLTANKPGQLVKKSVWICGVSKVARQFHAQAGIIFQAGCVVFAGYVAQCARLD